MINHLKILGLLIVIALILWLGATTTQLALMYFPVESSITAIFFTGLLTLSITAIVAIRINKDPIIAGLLSGIAYGLGASIAASLYSADKILPWLQPLVKTVLVLFGLA